MYRFGKVPSSLACNYSCPDRYERPHFQQYHRYTNHAEPIITGSVLVCKCPKQALKARHEPLVGRVRITMVTYTRSTLLIDDGIGMHSDSCIAGTAMSRRTLLPLIISTKARAFS